MTMARMAWMAAIGLYKSKRHRFVTESHQIWLHNRRQCRQNKARLVNLLLTYCLRFWLTSKIWLGWYPFSIFSQFSVFKCLADPQRTRMDAENFLWPPVFMNNIIYILLHFGWFFTPIFLILTRIKSFSASSSLQEKTENKLQSYNFWNFLLVFLLIKKHFHDIYVSTWYFTPLLHCKSFAGPVYFSPLLLP